MVKYALIPESEYKQLTSHKSSFYKHKDSLLAIDGQKKGGGGETFSNDREDSKTTDSGKVESKGEKEEQKSMDFEKPPPPGMPASLNDSLDTNEIRWIDVWVGL